MSEQHWPAQTRKCRFLPLGTIRIGAVQYDWHFAMFQRVHEGTLTSLPRREPVLGAKDVRWAGIGVLVSEPEMLPLRCL